MYLHYVRLNSATLRNLILEFSFRTSHLSLIFSFLLSFLFSYYIVLTWYLCKNPGKQFWKNRGKHFSLSICQWFLVVDIFRTVWHLSSFLPPPKLLLLLLSFSFLIFATFPCLISLSFLFSSCCFPASSSPS